MHSLAEPFWLPNSTSFLPHSISHHTRPVVLSLHFFCFWSFLGLGRFFTSQEAWRPFIPRSRLGRLSFLARPLGLPTWGFYPLLRLSCDRRPGSCGGALATAPPVPGAASTWTIAAALHHPPRAAGASRSPWDRGDWESVLPDHRRGAVAGHVTRRLSRGCRPPDQAVTWPGRLGEGKPTGGPWRAPRSGFRCCWRQRSLGGRRPCGHGPSTFRPLSCGTPSSRTASNSSTISVRPRRWAAPSSTRPSNATVTCSSVPWLSVFPTP